VRIDVFGGWAVEHDGAPVEVTGDRQRGLLFRLALDPGTAVGYRALAEDLWPDDLPENPKASLQSLVARLRPQLPDGVLASAPGGYRLAIRRDDVDAVRFQDAVAAASAAPPEQAAGLASAALALWAGEPWTPGEGYDWFERALRDDRETAVALGGSTATRVAESSSNIPAPLTALVGRAEELATVAAAVARSRLTTVLGPGGAGKTRLAVEFARRVPGAVLVELAPVAADELWNAVVGALGREMRTVEAQQQATQTARDRALATLAGRDVLLVVDNCEHVVDAAATVVHDLLTALPRLRVLATSREPLGVDGEAIVPLGPLADVDAEQLFAARVLAARGTPLAEHESEAATRIRARLDGMPLALELAAARTRTLGLAELDAGLDDRFALLATGPRTSLPRHQTLRALIDWSWELLDEPERRMLATGALYPAGIAAEDAAATAAAHGGTLAHLDALVDKSLLQRTGGRYRALETIREYGIERLHEWGTLDAERRIQLARVADAAAARDGIIRGAGVLDAVRWFDADDDNISAALRFGVDSGLAEDTVRLAAGTAWYWVIRDRNDDAMTWLAAIAPMAEGLTSDEAMLVHAVGVLSSLFGGAEPRRDEAARDRGGAPVPPTLSDETKAELRLLVAGATGRSHDLLQVLPVLIIAFENAMEQGNWPVAVELPAASTEHLSEWPRGMIMAMRAALAHNRGAIQELGEASAEALALFESNGDLWGLSLSKQLRAEWLILDGQLERALALNDESTEGMRHITSSLDLQQQQGSSIGILLRLGRADEAIERSRRQLAEAQVTGSSRALVLAEAQAAGLHLVLGDADAAEPHLAALESALAEWPDVPLQLISMADAARGGYARLRGDLDTAQEFMRSAAESAVASGDHPVMASVALSVGLVALDRGERDDARRALELAVTLRGAPDPLDPTEAHLRGTLGLTQVSPAPALESGEAGLDREAAAEALAQILRR
jgi:predicted ATPase